MKDIEAVNNLKLRLGWGQTGNAGNIAGKGVAALSGDAAYAFYVGGGGVSGYWGNRTRETGWFAPLVDTNLKWETTEMTNIGIDFSFLNDWDITLDYFVKNTKDLLLVQQIRPTAGFTVTTNGSGPYIRGIRLNGKPYDKPYIDYKDIVSGGTLEFTMGN